jgi:alkylation response protein AidB-like acyl-CoA dehydrogenase
VEIALRDVRVPRESVLEDSASAAVDGGHIGIAALAVGIARAAVEASLAYARERRVSASPSPRSRARSGASPTWRPPSSRPASSRFVRLF